MKNDVKDTIHREVVIQLNRFILLVTSILLLSLLEAQQGRYDRKSISTLGMIWDNGELKVVDENYKNLISSYIEVPRFDYNNKFVFWEGQKIPRANMNEGSHQLDWEADAEARVNKLKTKNKIKRNYYG